MTKEIDIADFSPKGVEVFAARVNDQISLVADFKNAIKITHEGFTAYNRPLPAAVGESIALARLQLGLNTFGFEKEINVKLGLKNIESKQKQFYLRLNMLFMCNPFVHTSYLAISVNSHGVVVGMVVGNSECHKVSFLARGGSDFIEKIEEELKEFNSDCVGVDVITKITEHGHTKQVVTIPLGVTKLNKDFYPYFENPEKIISDFFASKSNLLFMMGPPGTGKSSLTNYIYSITDRKIIMISDGAVHTHSYMTATLTNEILDNEFEPKLIVLEDADLIVGKRTEGNTAMSGILNLLDGSVSNNVKMIVITNIGNVSKVDEALLRPGRAFRTLQFKHLTSTQANAARESINLPAVSFTNHDGITLAEALNYEEVHHVEGGRAGFIQKG